MSAHVQVQNPLLPVRALLLLLLAAFPSAKSIADTDPVVVIHGAMDRSLAEPLLAGFARSHPDLPVRYEEIGTYDLYHNFLADLEAGRATADLLLSPAMDLQSKLANDGYALAQSIRRDADYPADAVWRNEAFAYSLEPVVIVYNKTSTRPDQIPDSRYRLLELLSQYPDEYLGRIGMYDPERSAAGYLYLTRDAEQSPVVWELLQRFGAVDVRLYDQAREILAAVATGELLIGYNLPASYALKWAEFNPSIGVLVPQDYALVIYRIALVPRTARHPDQAAAFLEFLLSLEGQSILAGSSGLFPVHPKAAGDGQLQGLAGASDGLLRPARMGPGLLVYVDQRKRENFLRRVRSALGQVRPP